MPCQRGCGQKDEGADVSARHWRYFGTRRG
jgi:hypothetical protein